MGWRNSLGALLSVGPGALSILGLGIILAAFDSARYESFRRKSGILRSLQNPDVQFAIDVGLILLEVGILGASNVAAVRLVFGILAVLFGIHAVRTRI